MSSLEAAEKAVESLSSEELDEFLRWFSSRLGERLGPVSQSRPSMQELAQRFDSKLQNESAKPFEGVDMSRWPENARKRAEDLIDQWQKSHGG